MEHHTNDHGGNLDAAIATYGGTRADWIDLSTGINPVPYPIGDLIAQSWTALPDSGAFERIERAARQFWNIPDEAHVVMGTGASALIARIPALVPHGAVSIAHPSYNEHQSAFAAHGWQIVPEDSPADAMVRVHPNNPTGTQYTIDPQGRSLVVIDESFADICPDDSHIDLARHKNVIVLKSFGKFWGLAGLRLGFAIGAPDHIKQLQDWLGPWAVSGPALEIGARALGDLTWAQQTRARLTRDAARLDHLMAPHSPSVQGTSLFRLYDVKDAAAFQARLAKHHIWSRIFPYSQTLIRLGLPHPDQFDRLSAALA